MKTLLALSAIVAGWSQTAVAQELRTFDPVTIANSVKCELSMFAKEIAKQRVDTTPTQAFVEVSGQELTHTKVGGSVDILFIKIGGGYTSEVTRKWKSSRPRNVSVDNSINCKKSNRVDVGILSCLRLQKTDFLEGAKIECGETVKASGEATGSAKIPAIWIINAGPSGEYSRTRTFDVSITAPPPKEK